MNNNVIERVTIGEIVELVTKGTTPRKGEGFVESGINYIKSECISYDGVIDKNKFVYIDEETHEKFKRSQIKEGDILFSMAGVFLGKNAVVQSDMIPANTNQALAIIRVENQLANSYFVAYSLRTKGMIRYINSMSAQSAQPNINFQEIKSLQIWLPDIPEQKAIAHILGTFDDKIELNRKMNETLEAMAQAMFKSWFVDFDPVFDNAIAEGNKIPKELKAKAKRRKAVLKSGKYKALPKNIQKLFPASFVFNEELGKWIPDGWDSVKLEDKLVIKRGGSPRPIKDFIVKEGYPWLKIADATSEKSPFIMKTREFIKEEGLRKTVYLDVGKLILSNSATPGLPKITSIKCCIHDGWLHFPEIIFFTNEYLYFLFQTLRETFISKGNGSVFTNLKTDILKNHRVVKSPKSLVDHFTSLAKQFLSRIEMSRIEIDTLTNQRNLLLSQLISGKTRLPKSFIKQFEAQTEVAL